VATVRLKTSDQGEVDGGCICLLDYHPVQLNKCLTAIERAPIHLISASPIEEPYRRVATRNVKCYGNYRLIMLSDETFGFNLDGNRTIAPEVISQPLPSERGLVSANTILVRCHIAPVLLHGDRFIENK
jgi:hypothetical protein